MEFVGKSLFPLRPGSSQKHAGGERGAIYRPHLGPESPPAVWAPRSLLSYQVKLTPPEDLPESSGSYRQLNQTYLIGRAHRGNAESDPVN